MYLENHPTADALRGYVLGTLNFREAAIVQLHVLECETCLDMLAAFHLGKLVLEEEAGRGEEMRPSEAELRA